MKRWVDENWKDEGFVGPMLPEEQETGRELVLPENAYNLSGSKQDIYIKNHEDEDKTLAERMNEESDYSTEEKKRKFIHGKFQIDENEISNQDKKT